MLDHLSLGVRDLARATEFYGEVLGTLGYVVHRRDEGESALGSGEEWNFFLYPVPVTQHVVGSRTHVAFRAPDRAAVRAFHDLALRSGGSAVPDRGPDERPQFGADYYGAVVLDPDGHAIEVLTRAPEAI